MTTSRSEKDWTKPEALAREAIALATQGRWQDAAEFNQKIVRLFPGDENAHNRLGKALMELGRYSAARDAFKRSLEIAPANTIARKNLQRLELLAEDIELRQEGRARPAPHHFIEETGKAGVTRLINLGQRKTLARLGAGDPVVLRVAGNSLMVDSASGEYIGQVEQRLGTRLLCLVAGGNRYEGSITSTGEDGISVILREVYQDPDQADKVSFPPKGPDGFRPYVKDSVKRYESDLQDSWEDDEEMEKLPEGMGFVGSGSQYIKIADDSEEDS